MAATRQRLPSRIPSCTPSTLRILTHSGAAPKKFRHPSWKPSFALELKSAVAGSQWPQCRLGQRRDRRGSSNLCQLCGEAPGTLLHRHHCAAVAQNVEQVPVPATAIPQVHDEDGRRGQILMTRHRGLLALRVALSAEPDEEDIHWYRSPPEVIPPHAFWVILLVVPSRAFWVKSGHLRALP